MAVLFLPPVSFAARVKLKYSPARTVSITSTCPVLKTKLMLFVNLHLSQHFILNFAPDSPLLYLLWTKNLGLDKSEAPELPVISTNSYSTLLSESLSVAEI